MESWGGGGGSMVQDGVLVNWDKSACDNSGANKVEVEVEDEASGNTQGPALVRGTGCWLTDRVVWSIPVEVEIGWVYYTFMWGFAHYVHIYTGIGTR